MKIWLNYQNFLSNIFRSKPQFLYILDLHKWLIWTLVRFYRPKIWHSKKAQFFQVKDIFWLWNYFTYITLNFHGGNFECRVWKLKMYTLIYACCTRKKGRVLEGLSKKLTFECFVTPFDLALYLNLYTI